MGEFRPVTQIVSYNNDLFCCLYRYDTRLFIASCKHVGDLYTQSSPASYFIIHRLALVERFLARPGLLARGYLLGHGDETLGKCMSFMSIKFIAARVVIDWLHCTVSSISMKAKCVWRTS